MMRKCLFLITIIGCLLLASSTAKASSAYPVSVEAVADEVAVNAADLVDTDQLDDFLHNLDQSLVGYDEQFSIGTLMKEVLSGKRDIDLRSIFLAVGEMFFGELLANSSFLGQLLVLSLLCVLLTLLNGSFSGGDISLLSRWVAYLLLFAPVVAIFSQSLNQALDAVVLINDFINVLLPVLLPLLAAVGGLTTVSIVNPLLLMALTITMGLMRNIIFPLIYFSAILKLIGQLSPRLAIEKLAGLFKDIALGIMSITMTVFVAFLSLSGMATASIDGLAVKAAKTASGIFIPVVGRSLADAMDSVLGTALILKNWIGLVGAVALLFICALPALQILVQSLLFKLAGAIIEPLGEPVLAEALTGIGKSMTLLFAALAISGLFAYFAIALVIGTGNLTMMLR